MKKIIYNPTPRQVAAKLKQAVKKLREAEEALMELQVTTAHKAGKVLNKAGENGLSQKQVETLAWDVKYYAGLQVAAEAGRRSVNSAVATIEKV